jgi:beta-glucosidase
MKMITGRQRRTFSSMLSFLLAGAFATFGQSGDFTNAGKVIASGGTGIANATVTYTNLSKRLSWDFSDANGNFGKGTGIQPNRSKPTDHIAVATGPLEVALFDVSGKKIASLHTTTIAAGSYLLEQYARQHSQSLFIAKIRTGGTDYCQKLLARGHAMVLPSGNALSPANGQPVSIKLVAAAAVDTIRIGKTGYTPVKVPITSYTADVGSVTLAPIDIEAQVTALFNQLSQAEKVGQLVQPDCPGASAVTSNLLGTIFGGGDDGAGSGHGTASEWATFSNQYQSASQSTGKKIPLLIGFDIVHGFGKCNGATVIPHNIGLGCTFSPSIVQKCHRVAGLESRSCGVNFAFGPCIAVPRDDRWGRVYEGFSETPELTQVMAKAAVLGFQTSDLSLPTAVAACVKHFAGDGGTQFGTGDQSRIDRGNTTGDETTLRTIHLTGYIAAIQAGAASVMASFSRWNGVRMHENKALLTDWLKTSQGFTGFVNGDWDGDNTGTSGTESCITNGLDIPMRGGAGTAGIGGLQNSFNNLYTNGNSARVDDAVKRLLRIKYRMGLFSTSLTTNSALTAQVGSQLHRDVAREGVRKSLVLLKTSANLFPLSKTAKITLVGPYSQDVGVQCGGWTMGWQGSSGNSMPGTTIRKGFETIGGASNISYSADGNGITGDVAVVCIGERPYAEWYGDTNNLTVPGASLVTAAKNSGKKVVVVLLSGRPLDISSVINSCDAFVAAWLPGTEGGGIAEVLYGTYEFSGKLAFSWPRTTAQEPINYGDASYDPLFPYDYGLNSAGQQLPKGIY